MNPFWTYVWPLLAAGLLIGVIGGVIGFRRKQRLPLIAAAVLTVAAVAAWHGPLGAADRFTVEVESAARRALNYYEMPKVTAHLHRGPLSRRLILVGPADDFQTSELARLFSQLPGVSRATWSASDTGLPLFVEGLLAALGTLIIGAGFAYALELRRRYNAQWTW